MAFFSTLFSVIGAIPAIERLLDSAFAAWALYKQEKVGAEIDTAIKSSESAVTSEDVKKAAHDAAQATRDL